MQEDKLHAIVHCQKSARKEKFNVQETFVDKEVIKNPYLVQRNEIGKK